MNRVISYPGQVPLTRDLLDASLFAQQDAAAVLEALRDSAEPGRYGLLVQAQSAPGLGVKVSRGIYCNRIVTDASAYSEIPADSTPIMKLGITHADTTMANVSLPTGSNQQVCAVQVGLAEADTDSTVLPFYNAANPSQALLGPGGAGTASNRRRQVTLALSYKYGATATSNPIAPVADAGQLILATFTLLSTTTQISGAADSSSNAQITDLLTGRISPFEEGLFTANTWAEDQTFAGIVAASTVVAVGSVAAGAKATAGADATLAADLTRLGQFASVSGASGYFTIPVITGNPIIVQWISATTTGGNATTAATFSAPWPKVFPNAVLAAVATTHSGSASIWNQTDGQNDCWINATVTAVGIYSTNPRAIKVIAIGN